MILAALAADAAPGKNFRHFRKVNENPDLEILHLWDQDDSSYELISPKTTAGIAELSQLVAGLKTISQVKNSIGFDVNQIVGQTQDSQGNAVVVLTRLGGESPDLSRYAAGPFSQSIGNALAQLHSLDLELVRNAGLPEYGAQEILHRKVAEVDRVAATGKIPARLLERWEEALEDVGLFRFHPTVTHRQINQDTLWISGNSVTGISGWSQLAIDDPAEDLRYLAGGALSTTFEDAVLHYRAARDAADENIVQRAILYSELELASWLAHCLQVGDAQMIADAQSMIADLDDQLKAQTLRSIRAAGFIGLGSVAAAGMTAQLDQVAQQQPPAEQQPEQAQEPNSDELF